MTLAELSSADLELLFWLVVLACLCGAAYMAYRGAAVACGLFLLVAVVAALIAV